MTIFYKLLTFLAEKVLSEKTTIFLQKSVILWFPNTKLAHDAQCLLDTVGYLKFSKNNQIEFLSSYKLMKLKLSDIVPQLDNIDSIDYSIGNKFPLDYFDLITGIHHEHTLVPTFNVEEEKQIKTILTSLFRNPDKEEILRKLGATDDDFVIMRFDNEKLHEMAHDNSGLNIYEVATKFRLFDISPLKSLPLSWLFKFEISLDGYPNVNLYNEFGGLEFVITTHSNDDSLAKRSVNKLAIIISDAGMNVWNSKILNECFKNIIPIFDEIILLGNGNKPINLEYVSESIIKAYNNYQNLDAVMVVLTKHGIQENDFCIDRFVENLPNAFKANQTIYILDSCYGGKYHDNYHKSACLISFNDGKHDHLQKDSMFYYGDQLAEHMAQNPNLLESIADFYTKNRHNLYLNKDVYISGEVNGKIVQKLPIYELSQILSQDSVENHDIPKTTFLGDMFDYINDNCTIL